MERVKEPVLERGVCEQRFDVDCEGRTVPALLWTPEEKVANAIVLLGHGGSLNKRADYILAIARRLVRHHGVSALAIDGPGHGDRRADGGTDPERVDKGFEAAWSRPEATDEIVADWKAALGAVQSEWGSGPIGYFGLSMGTMMGVPVIAALPEVRVAVLGLMGVWGPNAERLAADAPEVSCPVRFLAQWDDEIIPRDKVLQLFDLLGTRQKGLHAYPGKHAAVPAPEMRAVSDFLASYLRQ